MSLLRDAVRVLFILDAGCERLEGAADDDAGRVFRGEAKLLAYDFWVRYPDYLADELLNLFESSRERSLLDEVDRIFGEEEPDIRRIPMLRYRFGAWDKVDNAISVLSARGLVRRVERRAGLQVQEIDYLLFEGAFDLARTIERDFPALRWYARRTALVARVAGADGGGALKERQYRRIEYETTPLRAPIPPIKESVLARLGALRGMAA